MYSEDIKKLALRLYDKLSSLRKVASILETSYSTISRWKNSKEHIRKQMKTKLGPSDITESINLYILSHPFCSLKDIQNIIKEMFNFSVSLELIRLFIKKQNLTKKRARFYSVPKDDEIKLKDFIIKRKQFVKENRVFISVDETSFGRNYLSTFGYSKKGQRLNIKRPMRRVTTQSVISAISINNPIVYLQKEGSFNSESFYNFLNTLNFPTKSVLIMDNVRFHHSKIIKELILQKGWDILYTVPYSPIFNPIEGVFSIVKRHYQKFMSIKDAFKSVTNDHIKSFFNQSFKAVSRF